MKKISILVLLGVFCLGSSGVNAQAMGPSGAVKVSKKITSAADVGGYVKAADWSQDIVTYSFGQEGMTFGEKLDAEKKVSDDVKVCLKSQLPGWLLNFKAGRIPVLKSEALSSLPSKISCSNTDLNISYSNSRVSAGSPNKFLNGIVLGWGLCRCINCLCADEGQYGGCSDCPADSCPGNCKEKDFVSPTGE